MPDGFITQNHLVSCQGKVFGKEKPLSKNTWQGDCMDHLTVTITIWYMLFLPISWTDNGLLQIIGICVSPICFHYFITNKWSVYCSVGLDNMGWKLYRNFFRFYLDAWDISIFSSPKSTSLMLELERKIGHYTLFDQISLWCDNIVERTIETFKKIWTQFHFDQ